MSAQPLRDVLLWLRWMLGAGVVFWLPGYLVAGRWCAVDRSSRVWISVAMGMLLVPPLGLLCDALGVPVRPVTVIPTGIALAAGLSRWRRHRETVARWTDGIAPLPGYAQRILWGLAVAALVIHVAGLSPLPVPPHDIDGSNHAWMTQRVAEAETLRPAVVLATPWGRPPRDYPLGLQANAAMVARVTGVAPYISIWYLALICCAGLGWTLSLLWRSWRLPAPAAVFACALVAFDPLVPSGALQWGGFGLLAGFFLVPLLVLVIGATLRGTALAAGGIENESWLAVGAWNGLFAGLTIVSLVMIHASEVVVAGLLLAAGASAGWPRVLPTARLDRATQARLVGVLIVAAVLGITWFALRDFVAVYRKELQSLASPTMSLGRAVETYLRAGGKSVVHEVLAAVGLALALARRERRSIAGMSIVLAVVYGLRVVVADSFSQWISTPFYGVGYRVLYLQIFFLPAIMAWVGHDLAGWIQRRKLGGRVVPASTTLLGLGLILVLVVTPGFVRSITAMRETVPFSLADYRLAREASRRLGPGARIVNGWFDGSTWVGHVARRKLLLPCSWEMIDDDGGSLREAARSLLHRPWSDAALRLRDEGFTYVYATDTALSFTTPVFSRERLDADGRFEIVLAGEDSAIYRILWDADVEGSEPRAAEPGVSSSSSR